MDANQADKYSYGATVYKPTTTKKQPQPSPSRYQRQRLLATNNAKKVNVKSPKEKRKENTKVAEVPKGTKPHGRELTRIPEAGTHGTTSSGPIHASGTMSEPGVTMIGKRKNMKTMPDGKVTMQLGLSKI